MVDDDDSFQFRVTVQQKAKKNIFSKVTVITTIIIKLTNTVICRIGFSGPIPLTKMDIQDKPWPFFSLLGLFGLFPEVLVVIVFVMERLVDLIFWFFLRLGNYMHDTENLDQIEIFWDWIPPLKNRARKNDTDAQIREIKEANPNPNRNNTIKQYDPIDRK